MTKEYEKKEADTKMEPSQQVPAQPVAQSPYPPQTNNNALAIVSAVLGIISLTGPGLILGIPAIVTGAIALKRKQGEKGLSITGLVTGIVSTVISILVIVGVVFLVIWSASQPDLKNKPYQSSPERTEKHMFEQNQT